MEVIGLFNLIEEYIAKNNAKIDEVEQLLTASKLSGVDHEVTKILQRLHRILSEHKIRLEDLIDDLEYDERSDPFFICHHDTKVNKMISE